MTEHIDENIEMKNIEKSSEILVSVVVITYNSAKYVLETLESTKAQTYRNIELIITDDSSKDNTIEICQNWLEENKQRFVRTKLITSDTNIGISANLNRGLHAVNGEWVKEVAGDDILTRNCIKECIEFVQSKNNENVQIIHGSAKMYDEEFKEENFVVKWRKPEWKFNRNDITANEQYNILLRACPVLAVTVFFKKSIFAEVGYFNEDFPYWEDKPMWLKLTKAGIKIYFLDSELACYRDHKESVRKGQNKSYFSKFLISRDIASSKIILPNLPVFERFLNWYLIFIRKSMIQLGLSRNNKVTHFFYRMMTFLVENRLTKLNLHFKD